MDVALFSGLRRIRLRSFTLYRRAATRSLHRIHWIVVGSSLAVTFLAWHLATAQLDDETAIRFERYALREVELVVERMRTYEDALWAGVGALRAHDSRLTDTQWITFAQTLNVERRYPGINGLGVIYNVERDELETYLAEQRKSRPDFRIYPDHDRDQRLPITYIEPAQTNQAAVGLDMAHENNRLSAALKARDSGKAQITAPVTLVQDEGETPGFLFYAPFYDSDLLATPDDRRTHFAGMVYAPFVVEKLMGDLLHRENNYAALSIRDGSMTMYDEHHVGSDDFDPNPIQATTTAVNLYGRNWTFDIRSTLSFRSSINATRPITILLSGLAIDAVLLAFFILLASTQRKASEYARTTTMQLRDKTKELEKQTSELLRSNEELNRFAAVASHDLQEPLRKIRTFGSLLRSSLTDCDSTTMDYLNRMLGGAARMQTLIRDILALSQVSTTEHSFERVNLGTLVRSVVEDMQVVVRESGATITVDALPTIQADPSQMRQLFQNLIGNALKYRRESASPVIRIACTSVPPEQARFRRTSSEANWYEIRVQDNGIGFDVKYTDRIFRPFQRLHGRSEFEGNGIGLAICDRVVKNHGGEIAVESIVGRGSTFTVHLPAQASPTRSSVEEPHANLTQVD